METEAQPKTSEELIPESKRSQEMFYETEKDLENEKRRKTFWKVLVTVITCIWLYEKKSHSVWLPVADSQQMCVAVSDWWGLKVQVYYPVWRKPTGEPQEYLEQWCIKHPDNSWRVFYGGHGKSPAYTYPQVIYSTYF